MLVVQGKLFVQSPLRVKSSKAKRQIEKKGEKNMQPAQTTSPEIDFKMQLVLNNFTKQK